MLTFVVAAIDGTTKRSRPLPEPIRAALLASVAPEVP
jgi:acyl-CoA thioesterase FadM